MPKGSSELGGIDEFEAFLVGVGYEGEALADALGLASAIRVAGQWAARRVRARPGAQCLATRHQLGSGRGTSRAHRSASGRRTRSPDPGEPSDPEPPAAHLRAGGAR